MTTTARIVRRNLIKLPTAASFKGPTFVKVGLPASGSSASSIQKGIWQEFGTKGSGKRFGTPRGGGFGGPIPERPFMRNAMRDNQTKYRESMAKSARKILRGDTAIRTVLSRLGAVAQGDIQSEITSLSSPANSPVTIAIKGSSNPLIDSGAMRQAITWVIENV